MANQLAHRFNDIQIIVNITNNKIHLRYLRLFMNETFLYNLGRSLFHNQENITHNIPMANPIAMNATITALIFGRCLP